MKNVCVFLHVFSCYCAVEYWSMYLNYSVDVSLFYTYNKFKISMEYFLIILGLHAVKGWMDIYLHVVENLALLFFGLLLRGWKISCTTKSCKFLPIIIRSVIYKAIKNHLLIIHLLFSPCSDVLFTDFQMHTSTLLDHLQVLNSQRRYVVTGLQFIELVLCLFAFNFLFLSAILPWVYMIWCCFP